MKSYIERRVLDEAEYIIENEATVRKTGKIFKISKSTVHKDMKDRLYEISPAKYEMVKSVFEKNLEERHIRGGLATKLKYSK